MSTETFLPPADPKANYLAHREEIDAAVRRALEGGSYILGREVEAFEREFADYLGARQSAGVGNGTDALHLALRACGVGPGDAVITVSHTAVATVAAIHMAGAAAVLVDVDEDTFTMDVNQLEEAVKKFKGGAAGRLKAVVPVHLYGLPADMPAVMRIAEAHGLRVIEDCAQAHGASVAGKKAGTFGHAAAFSFYPTKNLGAIGDGGAVVTDSAEVAEQARLLREYGWRERYVSDLRGMNTRLDELQAAILRVKLRHLDAENARRREIASLYDDALSASPLLTPRLHGRAGHVYHQYVVRHRRRDDLREFLRANCVGTLIHYPVPVHLQPAYRSGAVEVFGDLARTERLAREILSLPIYPQMADEQARRVCEVIKLWRPRAAAGE